MTTITTRAGKGSPLTNTELDNNFTNLNTAKYESGDSISVSGFNLTNGNPSLNVTANTNNWAALDIQAGDTQANYVFFRDANAERARITVLNNNDLSFSTSANQQRLLLSATSTIFNEQSYDTDFRIESNDNSHMFYINAATNKIGVRNTNPNYVLDVYGNNELPLGIRFAQSLQDITDSNEHIGVRVDHNRYEQTGGTMNATGEHTGFEYSLATGGSANATISGDTYGVKVTRSMGSGGNTTGTNYGYYYNSATYGSSSGVTYAFYSNNTAPNSNGGRYAFYNADDNATSVFNGASIFNETGGNADFRVESDTNSHALFVDASANTVAVGGTGGWGTLQVIGATNSEYRTFFVSESTDASKGVGISYDPTNDRGVIAAVDGGTGWKNVAIAPSGGYVSVGLPTTQSIVAPLHIEGGSSMTGGWTRTLHLEALFPVMTFQSTFNTDTYAGIGYDTTNDNIDFWVGATTSDVSSDGKRVLRLKNYEAAFNEDSQNIDFRVESDSLSHAFFVDAGTSAVGIGNVASSAAHLNVDGNIGGGYGGVIRMNNDGTDGCSGFIGVTDTNWTIGSGKLIIGRSIKGNAPASAYAEMTISASEVVFNENSNDRDFRVESDSLSHALFVDAGNNNVCAGASNGSNYGARFMSSISGGSSNATIACVNTSTSGTRRQIDFFDGSSTSRKGSIETNGTGTTYNTTSDRRLKDNIEPIADGTEKLMAMKPVTHTWKADPEAGAVHGFIAQEMQEIVPEAVSGGPHEEDMMSMDYGRITPVLVAALQDAHKKIAELEARLNTLEGK